jgi:hypothetical protein
MAITCTTFIVVVLNVVVINSICKMVNVSCDDNVVICHILSCAISCIYNYVLMFF